jgi:hypothetical protein
MPCTRFDENERRHRSRMRATRGDGFEAFGGITPVVEFREPDRDCGESTSTAASGTQTKFTTVYF